MPKSWIILLMKDFEQALRNLATLGGFLGRKSDGDPGAKSIWIGFQRIQDCVFGIQIARKLEEGLD